MDNDTRKRNRAIVARAMQLDGTLGVLKELYSVPLNDLEAMDQDKRMFTLGQLAFLEDLERAIEVSAQETNLDE